MLSFKPGVEIKGVSQNCIVLIHVTACAYEACGIDTVVTSVKDGRHKAGSKHYIGDAADFRTKNISKKDELLWIVNTVRKKLGRDFDVVMESDHLHIEYDKKAA